MNVAAAVMGILTLFAAFALGATLARAVILGGPRAERDRRVLAAAERIAALISAYVRLQQALQAARDPSDDRDRIRRQIGDIEDEIVPLFQALIWEFGA